MLATLTLLVLATSSIFPVCQALQPLGGETSRNGFGTPLLEQLRDSAPEQLRDLAPLPALAPIPGADQVRSLTVARDGGEGLWAVWEVDDGVDVDLYYSRWTAGEWSSPQPVHHRPNAWDRSPTLVVAADGTPWLAWSAAERADPDQNSLYVSRWAHGGWTSPEMVPVGDIPEATEPAPERLRDPAPERLRDPALAVAPDGTLWLAWVGSDVAAGQDDEIFASHWDGTTWSFPQRVSADDRDPPGTASGLCPGMASGLCSQYDRQPRLAVGQDGRPWLVWTGHQAGVDDEIYASHWTGTEWTPEQAISADDDALDVSPSLALDTRGRPWVAWKGRVTEGGHSRLRILVSHWDASRSAWLTETLASSPLQSAVDEGLPALSSDGKDGMHLAWIVTSGTGSALAYAHWQDGKWAEAQWVRSGVTADAVAWVTAGDGAPGLLWLDPASNSQPPLESVSVEGILNPLSDWIDGQAPAKEILAGEDPFPNRYLAFGDSITYGGYSGYPYPDRLNDKLDIRVAKSEVINSGNPGEATYGGSERITGQVSTYRPQYVLIMEGTNDVTRDKLPSDVQDNIKTMIDNARENAGVDNVKVMLATIIPRRDDLNDETEEMNQQAVVPAALAKGVPLCDQWLAFITTPFWQSLFVDHVHPSGAGLQLIADTFYNRLLAVYPELEEETTPPLTWIESVPPSVECGQTVPVRWSGSDDLNWVVDYDVQVQVNDGPWSDWLVDTQSTSGSYTPANSTYADRLGFRVRGRDLLGNESDYSEPAYTQIADSVPPYEAHVDPLPPVCLVPCTVSWWGRDACADVVAYRVQYSVGGTSNWVDWLYPTSNTSGSFTPSLPAYGQTCYFRVQAEDAAGNWGDWSEAEAHTVLARFSLEGGVYNLRHQPVAAAQVGITPAPLWLGSQLGGFLAYTASSDNYDITVSRDDLYGTLPAMVDLPVNQNVSGLQFILPPHDDAVADGGFEAGNLAGAWQVGGTTLPVLTGSAHTGQGAVRLDGAAGDSRLSQTVTPASGLTEATGGETPPLLSFLVRLDVAGPASVLRIELGSPPVIYDLPVGDTRWTHVWYDLAGPVGEPLTLTFVVSGNPAVILDEVSLGSALVGGRWVYLPISRLGW